MIPNENVHATVESEENFAAATQLRFEMASTFEMYFEQHLGKNGRIFQLFSTWYDMAQKKQAQGKTGHKDGISAGSASNDSLTFCCQFGRILSYVQICQKS